LQHHRFLSKDQAMGQLLNSVKQSKVVEVVVTVFELEVEVEDDVVVDVLVEGSVVTDVRVNEVAVTAV